MTEEETVQEIMDAFGTGEAPKSDPILKSRVLAWMRDEGIEVNGCIYAYVTERRYAARISPPLVFADFQQFLLGYYRRCLLENPQGEWSNSSYGAAADLVNWFRVVASDKTLPKTAFSELKKFVEELYKNGDEDLRTCLVTGTLEHVFEDRTLKRAFDDWKQDPILSKAYDQAADWSPDFGS